jgi:tetratricopeptide (TPR) repeat protein
VAYANALRNGFVWDDHNLVIGNPLIKSVAELGSLLTSPLQANSEYFRPVQAVTFLVDYQVFGSTPGGFHLTSILIHAAVGVLFYLFAARLFDDGFAALCAALLFVVHPVHTEAVTYVSGRSDPLGALFLLAALWWFLEPSRLLLSLVAFLLALLSRETTMGLLPLLVLVDVADARRRNEALHGTWGRRIARRYLPYVGLLGLYLVMRWLVVGGSEVTPQTAELPLATRLLTMTKVVLQYVGLLVFPRHLHMERNTVPSTSPLDPAVLGSIAVLALAAWALVRWRRAVWPLAFGCAWFALGLLPVANLVPLSTFMAEHWLYVPSMGVFIAAGWGLGRLAARAGRPAAIAVVGLLVLAYGARTIARNRDWRDERSIFEATLRFAPESARVHTNLGRVHWEARDYPRARQEFDRAIELAPSSWQTADAHNFRGILYQQEGRHQEAIAEFGRAIELNRLSAVPYPNLATSLQALGRMDEARRALESALVLDPRSSSAHVNLGNMLFNAGDLADARDHYLRALALNPENPEAHNNLGSVYFNQGRPDLAEREFRTSLRLNPNQPMVQQNLGVAVRAQQAAAGPGAGQSPPR